MNTLKYESKKKEDGDKDTLCCYTPTFPSVDLTGNQVSAVFGEGPLKAGDVYETTFQFKVSSIQVPIEGDEDNKERRVTLKLIAADSVEGAEETEDEPADDEGEAEKKA